MWRSRGVLLAEKMRRRITLPEDVHPVRHSFPWIYRAPAFLRNLSLKDF
ncbi:MAG: hypothetical protein FGF51_02535 [Candidatus Brockarchaeota archaeon]|nr:hypothetical protein [Candidatus Brockarchaeota archaeon]